MATAPMTARVAAVRCTRELAWTRMTEPPGLRPRAVTLKHPHPQHQPLLPHEQQHGAPEAGDAVARGGKRAKRDGAPAEAGAPWKSVPTTSGGDGSLALAGHEH